MSTFYFHGDFGNHGKLRANAHVLSQYSINKIIQIDTTTARMKVSRFRRVLILLIKLLTPGSRPL